MKSKKTLLIIDDDAFLRNSLKDYFADRQFTVYDASNIKESLKKIKLFRPNVVLLDIFLQGELGLDFAITVKHDNSISKKTIVIAMSGTVGKELLSSEKYLEEIHISAFFEKPFDFGELHQKILHLMKL